MRFAASDILALEPHLMRGWPAARVVELHGWRCGLDRGVTRRPNSVWALAWDGGVELAAAIAEAAALYREAGLRPCFRIADAVRPAGLDAALAAEGYRSEGASHVLVAPFSAAQGETPLSTAAETVLLEAPDAAWLACYEEGLASEAERRAVRGLFARIADPHVFAAAISGGKVASVALAVLSGPWVQIAAVRTLPDFRRRGLANAVMTAVRGWARQEGAGRLALMVEAGNVPALELYRKAGFSRVYGYHYRTADLQAAGTAKAPRAAGVPPC